MNLEISSTVMAMFSDYESRPTTRKAILIDDSMLITKINGESTWELKVKNSDASLFFKAYVQPVVGDYIVHLKHDEVYHVDAVTFAERNIIPADMNFMDELKQNFDRNMQDFGISVSRGPASASIELVAPKISKERIDKVKQKLPDVREWPNEYYQVDIRNPLFISKLLYVPRDNKIECSRFLTLMFRKVTTSVGVKWELIEEDKCKELIE
ncbi:hypothetical protein [Pseudoalteromonas sp. ASV78]|uniref:hypothetical protein n=1 Tax=Pseudoalteromonas sp. ASV78 TaxID=3397851 RepID=UPI0039FCEC70